MRRAWLVVLLAALAGCKQADPKRIDAYVQASVRTAQLFDGLLKDRCARVTKGSTWQSASEDTHAKYQEYVKASNDAVATYDALMKSEPPSDVLAKQQAASDAGRALAEKRDAYQKVCTEKFGKGPDVDRTRGEMDTALNAYLAALRSLSK